MQTTTAVRLVAGGAALACLVIAITPGTARADENSFLARVHAANMPLTDDKALKLGHATCIDLSHGIPMSAILASNNPAVGPGPFLSPSQNWELFSSAVSELCPQFQTGY